MSDIIEEAEIPFEQAEDFDEESEEQQLYEDYADILEDEGVIEE